MKVGAVFTQIYNFRQLQINQVTALDRLRPLLTSEKPEEREFGYASFVALGYEGVAIRMIALQKDESGRQVLIDLAVRPHRYRPTQAVRCGHWTKPGR